MFLLLPNKKIIQILMKRRALVPSYQFTESITILALFAYLVMKAINLATLTLAKRNLSSKFKDMRAVSQGIRCGITSGIDPNIVYHEPYSRIGIPV